MSNTVVVVMYSLQKNCTRMVGFFLHILYGKTVHLGEENRGFFAYIRARQFVQFVQFCYARGYTRSGAQPPYKGGLYIPYALLPGHPQRGPPNHWCGSGKSVLP